MPLITCGFRAFKFCRKRAPYTRPVIGLRCLRLVLTVLAVLTVLRLLSAVLERERLLLSVFARERLPLSVFAEWAMQ